MKFNVYHCGSPTFLYRLIIMTIVSSYIAHTQCSVCFTHITPGHWTCSFMCHFNSLIAAYNTCSHFGVRKLSHTLLSLSDHYLFTPESSEACEGKVPCPRTHHRNNVPILRGETHDIGKAPRSNHCATSLSTIAFRN